MTALQTRLFLVAAPGREPAESAGCLAAACEAGDVACLLVRTDADGEHDEALASALVETGQAHGVAVVIENDVTLAKKLGADGVHVVAGADEVRAARREMGEEAIVGAECRGRRHDAMELGEAGIDYIALDQRLEAGGETLIDWWVEIFVIPVVAIHPAGPEAMAELAAAGVDFVCPPEAMWRSEEEAHRVIAGCMEALAGRSGA